MSAYNLCIIIPVYNHHPFIAATIEKIKPYGHKIFLVDDGSVAACNKVLRHITAQNAAIELITLPHNAGKGAAVMRGFEEAVAQGFTHALQIDADGQHDVDDIEKFIALSKSEPDALISGRPVYDDSVPKARLYGRYLTHVWVWIETLSRDIQDSMCGFRIYPLVATVALMKRVQITQRMDFDIDIMVRLYWQGVPVRFIKTRVIYPPDGISHFKGLGDNWRISKLHTRLFFGMLPRIPRLLMRRLKR